MDSAITMWKDLMPVLVELIKAGKTVGIWYIIAISIIPLLQIVIKYTFIYKIVEVVINGVKYLFENETAKKTK